MRSSTQKNRRILCEKLNYLIILQAIGECIMRENIKVKIKINEDARHDPELLDTYSRRLREEILELDVDSVEYASQADAPKGSKGIGTAVGDMILSLAPLDYALSGVMGAVQSFATRNDQCGITVEIGDNRIIIDGSSPEEQQKLVDTWIKRVSEE